MYIRQAVMTLLLVFAVLATSTASDNTDDKAFDPFDYNFCGGERVYPIVGVNLSTACGPRNQIALGRRGKLMWFFPGEDTGRPGARKSYQGKIKLSKQQLAYFSTLAEVAKLTDPDEPKPEHILYKMGINFSGTPPKYIYAAFTGTYTPSNELLRQLLASIPGDAKPYLPDCGVTAALFDPTLNQNERAARQSHTTQ